MIARRLSGASGWLTTLRQGLVMLLGIGALLVILLPLIYVLWISFTPGELLQPPTGQWSWRWYSLFFASPQWTQGLLNSFWVAGMTVVGSLLAGGGVALAVTRYHFRYAQLISGAVLLPLFVPAVVLAMALLPFVHRIGLWGTKVSIAAGHSLWSMPVAFLLIRSALEDLDPDLEQAAQGLGAGAITIFRRITLPIIAPAMIVGAIMAFIISLNEFVIALFLGTSATETLPKVIWPNLRYTLTPLVAAASSVTMGLTLLGVALVILVFRVGRIRH
ncbi:ABC transporter permease [Leptolyngbya sp. AN02str]|uniref:ABC transporter permease n=1 Tax=Leptolyngbya sp. AN02str TaxID=3423363 RepID=UPI003D315D5F